MRRWDYRLNKRLNHIRKANKPLHVALEELMNAYIDDCVLNGISNDLHTLEWRIREYNYQFTMKDLIRLARPKDNIAYLDTLASARNITDILTRIELKRVQDNLNYINATLDKAELDMSKYESLIRKLPQHISRQDILEEALTKGENYKGTEYSYKQLSRLGQDLEKYKTNHSSYEAGMIQNKTADREGLPLPNTEKVWIWSTLEDTRHHYMDGQTVRFTEKFRVENEQTGDLDYLRFPGDVENDHNGCSNICNCMCNYLIR